MQKMFSDRNHANVIKIVSEEGSSLSFLTKLYRKIKGERECYHQVVHGGCAFLWMFVSLRLVSVDMI